MLALLAALAAGLLLTHAPAMAQQAGLTGALTPDGLPRPATPQAPPPTAPP